jgi:adenylate cyclase
MVALFVCVLVLIAMYIPFRIRKTSLQIMVILGVSLFSILITYITAHYKYLLSTSLLLLPYIIISVYSIMFRYGITEKHNEHVRSLFGKYVHKDVLDELLQHGKDIKLGGERRVVSILFSDIRGFTSFSETMSPEELTSLLNGYLSAMSPKILEEKGTIDKFIGDAIMAFWNAPLRIEQHELHAVKAALLMVDALELFNKEYGSPLAVGIGVHTGEVVVGNIGSLDRVNYTVLGDVVNTASRLEGLTKKYGVSLLVSDEIRNKVQDDNIIFRKLDTITVKGKSEPTIIYEVGRKGNISSDTITQYEKGLALYGDGALDAAYVIFKSLAEQGDIPSMKMTEKIPSIDRKTWDGVWHFDEK